MAINDKEVIVNDVPMQGKGFYSSNSGLQHMAMLEALPLVRRAIAETGVERISQSRRSFTVIEYGSGHGNNS